MFSKFGALCRGVARNFLMGGVEYFLERIIQELRGGVLLSAILAKNVGTENLDWTGTQ